MIKRAGQCSMLSVLDISGNYQFNFSQIPGSRGVIAQLLSRAIIASLLMFYRCLTTTISLVGFVFTHIKTVHHFIIVKKVQVDCKLFFVNISF